MLVDKKFVDKMLVDKKFVDKMLVKMIGLFQKANYKTLI